MNTRILNRDFLHPDDGWYQIEAKGEHPNRRAGIIQIIDDKACESIVNRFNAEAAKPGFAGMLIDHEHFKHDEAQETIAYGWLTALQNRADGPYGQIRWTDTGKKAVDGGDYRFFSTEYNPADMVVLNGKKPKQVRPMRLDGLTLTNVNNNKGQKPITNRHSMNDSTASKLADIILAASQEIGGEITNRREAAFAAEKILNGDFPGHPFHGNQYAEASSGGSRRERASSVAHEASRAAFESGEKSDHEHAAAMHKHAAAQANKAGNKSLAVYHDTMANMHADMAAGKIKNRFPSTFGGTDHQQQDNTTTMKTVLAELGLGAEASEPAALAEVRKIKNRVSELETAQVETDLEVFAKKIDPKQREFVKNMLVTNRAGTVEYLKALPNIPGAIAPARIHNRSAATPADKSVGGEDEAALSASRNEAIDNYKVTNRCSFQQAHDAVRRKSPELFGITSKK
jgi:hypothetical protein